MRELTDDSRRGASGTAHKMHWMKEHYSGGRLLQKHAVARFMQYEDCIGTLFPREERTPLSAIRQ